MKQIAQAPCHCGSRQTYALCCGMQSILLPRACAQPGDDTTPHCSGAPVGWDVEVAHAVAFLAEERERSEFRLGGGFPSTRACPRCAAPFQVAWSVYHDTAQDPGGRTLAERILSEAPEQFSDQALRWVMLQPLSWISIWRVGRRDPHPTIRGLRVPKLTDLITGEECRPAGEWDSTWAPARSAVLARAIPTTDGAELGAVHPVPALRRSADYILDDLWCHPDLERSRRLQTADLRKRAWINHLIGLWEAPIIETGMLTDDL